MRGLFSNLLRIRTSFLITNTWSTSERWGEASTMVCVLLSHPPRRVTMLHGSVRPEPKTNMQAVSYPSRPWMSLSDLPNVSKEEDSHLHIRGFVLQVSQMSIKHLTLITEHTLFKSNHFRSSAHWRFREKPYPVEEDSEPLVWGHWVKKCPWRLLLLVLSTLTS